MTSWFRPKMRDVLGRRLPKAKLSLYVVLASRVLTLFALIAAGAVFEVQRVDLLLFELEQRYREYDYLEASTECVLRGEPGPNHRQHGGRVVAGLAVCLRSKITTREFQP